MGTKRSWEGQPVPLHQKPDDAMPPSDSHSTTLSIFEHFRDELDEHHDRRERIIKTSRDITALSKKIIFALQRVRAINQPLPANIATENQARIDQILQLFARIAPDLQGIKGWRYQRNISGGIQEFIEALSFDHYLRTQTLITQPEVTARLPDGIMVTEEDYLMGLFDLTGEIMRFAVLQLSSGNAMATQSTSEAAENGSSETQTPTPRLSSTQAGVVIDLRTMRARCEALSVPGKYQYHMMRDLKDKIGVMQNSVEKVERAAYGILVRGSERPSGWTPDLYRGIEVETS